MSTSETITRTDLANVLNEILPVYNSTGFTVEKFTASSATSVSANGGTAWIQVRIPSGYTPICVVGYYLNGGSGCAVYNEALASDSNGYYASFALRNSQSTANSVTIDAYILCKQSLTHFTQAMADYIVEQGTSGIWTYRKWNSGIAECWGKTSVASTTYSANGGYKNVTESLPSGLFNAIPSVVNASGKINTCVQTHIGFTAPNDATSIQTYLVNRNSSSVTQAGEVYWEVKGTWK